MSRDAFRERYPLLYHLQEHHRIYTGLALAITALLWVVMETTMVSARLKKSLPQSRNVAAWFLSLR
jgi:hypothetical protein